MRLSVIMPVYNAERTLEQTLRSLFGQLDSHVDFIVVDDGSTDASPEILARFASEAGHCCRLIRQENAGAAAARNAAIDIAEGEYLVFLDADDRFETNSLEKILRLSESGADIIGWDWTDEADGKRRSMRQADFGTPEEALKNLMGGTMKWNLWLFAVKRTLVVDNGLHFIPGADMGEDMGFILKAFACAARVQQVHEFLYVYNATNPSSISAYLNDKRRKEVTENLYSATSFLFNSPSAQLAETYLPHLKLYIKLPLLIGFSKQDYQLWRQWMPEANPYAMANKALPFRTRLLQGMAARRFFVGVWCYNILYRLLTRFLFCIM